MDEFPWLPILLIICGFFLTLSMVKWAVAYIQYLWQTRQPLEHKKKHRKSRRNKKDDDSESSEESSSE